MNIHDAIMMVTREELAMVLAMAGRMGHRFTVEERERVKEMMKIPRLRCTEENE